MIGPKKPNYKKNYEQLQTTLVIQKQLRTTSNSLNNYTKSYKNLQKNQKRVWKQTTQNYNETTTNLHRAYNETTPTRHGIYNDTALTRCHNVTARVETACLICALICGDTHTHTSHRCTSSTNMFFITTMRLYTRAFPSCGMHRMEIHTHTTRIHQCFVSYENIGESDV